MSFGGILIRGTIIPTYNIEVRNYVIQLSFFNRRCRKQRRSFSVTPRPESSVQTHSSTHHTVATSGYQDDTISRSSGTCALHNWHTKICHKFDFRNRQQNKPVRNGHNGSGNTQGGTTMHEESLPPNRNSSSSSTPKYKHDGSNNNQKNQPHKPVRHKPNTSTHSTHLDTPV